MKFTFRCYDPHILIERIATQLDTPIKKGYSEKLIDLPASHGEGKINGFKFRNGISFFMFDVKLIQEMELEFINEVAPPLQLNFLSEGEATHLIDNGELKSELRPMQSSITSSKILGKQTIILPKKKRVVFALIFVIRSEFFSELVNVVEDRDLKIYQILFDTNGENNLMNNGSFSLEISRNLKKINSKLYTGLIRSIMVESTVLEMFGFRMRVFQEENLLKSREVNLSKSEINVIKLARDILIDDLVDAPTIVDLAKKVGINQQKLKQGFKVVYNMTINQYLTNIRLEYAVSNLESGATVKETAYEIGYSNLSHFAKKFKEKYGLLPKDYVKSIQTKIAVRSR